MVILLLCSKMPTARKREVLMPKFLLAPNGVSFGRLFSVRRHRAYLSVSKHPKGSNFASSTSSPSQAKLSSMSITRLQIVPTDELNQRNTQFGKFIPSWRCTSINSSSASRPCIAYCLGLRCGSMSVSKEPAQVVPRRNLPIVSRQRHDPLIVTQLL